VTKSHVVWLSGIVKAGFAGLRSGQGPRRTYPVSSTTFTSPSTPSPDRYGFWTPDLEREITRYVRKRTRQSDDRENIVGETRERMAIKILAGKLGDRRRIIPWGKRIAGNVIRDVHRDATYDARYGISQAASQGFVIEGTPSKEEAEDSMVKGMLRLRPRSEAPKIDRDTAGHKMVFAHVYDKIKRKYLPTLPSPDREILDAYFVQVITNRSEVGRILGIERHRVARTLRVLLDDLRHWIIEQAEKDSDCFWVVNWGDMPGDQKSTDEAA
jgi:RNA polymerase sigma factor (sigma-70 family)